MTSINGFNWKENYIPERLILKKKTKLQYLILII